MVSLRARLIAALLVVAAAGLLVAGAVTYAEQRSFLLNRVDQQVRSATGAVSVALDRAGFVPADRRPAVPGYAPDRDDDGGRRGPPPNATFGTFGQRRTASGKVLGSIQWDYNLGNLPKPKLPAKVSLGKTFTVGSTGGDLRYRVYAQPDPEDSGITIVAIPLRDVDQTLHRLLVVEAVVIGGVLALLAVLAYFVVRLELRPLDRIARVAGEIAAGRLSRRVTPATPGTEVGRLGLALNGMLERLERAFAEREASEDRLRQFVADASHELRTPLASIRGYAEVFHMGASADPEAVATSMKRIEEEATRMGVLVDDLLTLARLDELREPIREPVDLSELATDAVADARAMAPERPIELHTGGPAVVTGDPLQLRQVLANLMRNALVHTPDGSPVDVTVRQDGAGVAVEVRDYGPGLPDGDPRRLFERFWRAERGRTRGKGGAGLGLAIVGEIVDGHGGTVDAGNAEGGGARFLVRLPRAGSVDPQQVLTKASQQP